MFRISLDVYATSALQTIKQVNKNREVQARSFHDGEKRPKGKKIEIFPLSNGRT